jgi:hypothetical protein
MWKHFKRHGKMVLEFPSNQQPRIEALAWDKDNDSLAILTVRNHQIIISRLPMWFLFGQWAWENSKISSLLLIRIRLLMSAGLILTLSSALVQRKDP